MKQLYVITFFELEDGIVTNSGAFANGEKTKAAASEKMMEEADKWYKEIKHDAKRKNDYDRSITYDDSSDIPVLCVLREWNGTDYNIYAWSVSEVTIEKED